MSIPIGNPRECCPTLTGGNHAMWCEKYDRAMVVAPAKYVGYKHCCTSPVEGPHLLSCRFAANATSPSQTENLLATAVTLIVSAEERMQIERCEKWRRAAREFMDAYASWMAAR